VLVLHGEILVRKGNCPCWGKFLSSSKAIEASSIAEKGREVFRDKKGKGDGTIKTRGLFRLGGGKGEPSPGLKAPGREKGRTATFEKNSLFFASRKRKGIGGTPKTRRKLEQGGEEGFFQTAFPRGFET